MICMHNCTDCKRKWSITARDRGPQQVRRSRFGPTKLGIRTWHAARSRWHHPNIVVIVPSSSFEIASSLSLSFVGPTGLGQRAQRAVQFGRPRRASPSLNGSAKPQVHPCPGLPLSVLLCYHYYHTRCGLRRGVRCDMRSGRTTSLSRCSDLGVPPHHSWD